jgi:predicted transposase YbfD/YdcC
MTDKNMSLYFDPIVTVCVNFQDFRRPRGVRYSSGFLIFCLFLCECGKMFSQRSKSIWIFENWNLICTFWYNSSGISVNRKSSPSQSCLSRYLSGVNERDLKAVFYEFERKKFACEWIVFRKSIVSGNLILRFKKKIRDKRCLSKISHGKYPHFTFDGKSRKGVISLETGRTEIDVILFSPDTKQVLAQETLPDKEGESVAVEKIIDKIGGELPEGVFTADAGITSPRVTSVLKAKNHHYLFGLKSNAGRIYEYVKDYDWNLISTFYVQMCEGHGRQEIRKLKKLALSQLGTKEHKKYAGAKVVFRLEKKVHYPNTGKVTNEIRYFIGDEALSNMTLPQVATYIRNHWLQESFHWVKDAILKEDNCAQKTHNGSRVLAVLRNLVYGIGLKIFRSVKKFTDVFVSNPRKFIGVQDKK